MLFGFFGLGIPELIILALCCGVVVIIPVVVLLFTMRGGGSSAVDVKRRRGGGGGDWDRGPADAADGGDYKKGSGKTDKETGIKNEGKDAGFEKDSPGKDADETVDGGG